MTTTPTNPITGQPYTSEDYKAAAQMNLWAAKMERLHGNLEGNKAHRDLADLYIRQELRKARA